MWVWIVVGVAVWFAVSVLAGLALGRFFGALRRRIAAQRAELEESRKWADRPPERAAQEDETGVAAPPASGEASKRAQGM